MSMSAKNEASDARAHGPAGAIESMAGIDAAQIPLPLYLPQHLRFENFEVTPRSVEIVQALKSFAEGSSPASGHPARLFIAGEGGSGKSHLSVAVLRTAGGLGFDAALIPLRLWMDRPPGMIQGMERADLICIEDIDAIAGISRWEESLVFLIEASMRRKARLLVSARKQPAHIPFGLADLRSRLNASTVYRLPALDDEGRARALRRHAMDRGIDISDEIIAYLFARYRRDMPSLMALLERLDRRSLGARRRLTVPFVRQILESLDEPPLGEAMDEVRIDSS